MKKDFSLVTRPGDKTPTPAPAPKTPEPEPDPKSLLIVSPNIMEGSWKAFEVVGVLEGLDKSPVLPAIIAHIPRRDTKAAMLLDPRMLIYDYHYLDLLYTPRDYPSIKFSKRDAWWLKQHRGWGSQREIPINWLDDVVRWSDYCEKNIPTLEKPLSPDSVTKAELMCMAKQMAEQIEHCRMRRKQPPLFSWWGPEDLMVKGLHDNESDDAMATVERVWAKKPVAVATCVPSFYVSEEWLIERNLPINRRDLMDWFDAKGKLGDEEDYRNRMYLYEHQAAVGTIAHKSGVQMFWRVPKEVDHAIELYPRKLVELHDAWPEEGVSFDESGMNLLDIFLGGLNGQSDAR